MANFILSGIELLLRFVAGCVQLIQPILVPICFAIAWLVVILTLWSLTTAVRDVISRAQTMHRIPCANCRFFTNTPVLKCPVHPSNALSELAIDCPDYEGS
jgi:hypothetical protein